MAFKVTQNIDQYPLHHVTIKFEVAGANGLGGNTITRNRAHVRTHTGTDGRTDRPCYEINIHFFLKKRADMMKSKSPLNQLFCSFTHSSTPWSGHKVKTLFFLHKMAMLRIKYFVNGKKGRRRCKQNMPRTLGLVKRSDFEIVGLGRCQKSFYRICSCCISIHVETITLAVLHK